MRNKRKLMMAAVLILIVFTVAGCGTKATGGGWIDSIQEPECGEEVARATFGFFAEVVDECGWENAEGNFCLKDHGTGQQFHGKVDHMTLSGGSDYKALFTGMTSVSGRSPEPLPFTIMVYDSNENGKCDDGDGISITIGCIFWPEYFNEGALQGGNVNVD